MKKPKKKIITFPGSFDNSQKIIAMKKAAKALKLKKKKKR